MGLNRFGYTLVLPGMRAGLGLSAGEMGLIAGLALGAYLVCSLPAGALATRFGVRRTVTAGLMVSALGLAFTGLADGLAWAAAAQMLAGGAAAAVIVPVLSVGARWFGSAHWGRAGGVVVGGGGLGALWAGLLVPLLLGPDRSGSLDWRQAWFGLAACVAGIAVLAGWTLRDDPRGRRPASSGRPALRLVYRLGAVWHLGLVFFFYGLAYITYGTFFAAHLSTRAGFDASRIGLLWSLSGLVGIGGGLVCGLLSDRVGPRLTLILLFACQGVSEAALALGGDWGWFLFSALLYGLTVWSFAAVVSQGCAEAVGPELAPAAVSLAVVLMSIGQTLGPIVGGLLADRFGSFTPALLLAAGADVAGMIASLAMRPESGRRAS